MTQKRLTKPRISKISGIFVEFPTARARCGLCRKALDVTEQILLYRTFISHTNCLFNYFKERLQSNISSKDSYEKEFKDFKSGKGWYNSMNSGYFNSNIKRVDKAIDKWTEYIKALMEFIKNDPEMSTTLAATLLESSK